MQNLFSRFVKDGSGATAIEYGLIAAILSVAVVGTVGNVRDSLNETFTSIEGTLDQQAANP